jgi:hypothetical protein
VGRSRVAVTACAIACAILMVAAAGLAAPVAAQQRLRDPARVRFVTTDITHFWEAFAARATLGTATALDSLYFARATPGLRDFERLRLQDRAVFARTVDAAARYYASAQASTERIAAAEPDLRAMLRRFAELYPDAVFEDVYFVIGRLSSGGTTAPAGLLIGAEMYARTDDSLLARPLNDWHRAVIRPVDDIAAIVIHELMHEQQAQIGSSLLAQSLREGIADFVGELVSGKNINRTAVAYLDAHESALRAEFLAAADGTDLTRWLFNGTSSTDRPADLGYAVGHHIARAHYERATDKTAALTRMLTLRGEREARRFLDESGWVPR